MSGETGSLGHTVQGQDRMNMVGTGSGKEPHWDTGHSELCSPIFNHISSMFGDQRPWPTYEEYARLFLLFGHGISALRGAVSTLRVPVAFERTVALPGHLIT